MIIVGVKILPKKEVLDVQGRAIADMLKRQGRAIKNCQYGKFIRLTIHTDDLEFALGEAKKMAKSVLCNPLLETYELEILSDKPE